jgi:aryl-alcohol dehydrogenase-like predicted oxidoreductase
MSDFSNKVVLGRTGLSVSRLGVGSAYGVSYEACRKAFDCGINYFFWGSVRTPGMGLAVREIARTRREDIVVVLQCYVRPHRLVRRSIEMGLKKLGIDHADILLLGWHDKLPEEKLLETAIRMKGQGLFRFLGISSHQRPLFEKYLGDGVYDVFHVRYNAAHRGAEKEIFPYLPEKARSPGIVSFTNTRWGDLLKPKNMPFAITAPSASDCYRFVLSDSHVDVAICGPKNDAEMDEALSVLTSGPMDEEELLRMRLIGGHVHQTRSVMSMLSG